MYKILLLSFTLNNFCAEPVKIELCNNDLQASFANPYVIEGVHCLRWVFFFRLKDLSRYISNESNFPLLKSVTNNKQYRIGILDAKEEI